MQSTYNPMERVWAWFLTCAMLFSLLPVAAFGATDPSNPADVTVSISQPTAPGKGVKTVDLTATLGTPPASVSGGTWEWAASGATATFSAQAATTTATITSDISADTKVTFTATYTYDYTTKDESENDVVETGCTVSNTVEVTFLAPDLTVFPTGATISETGKTEEISRFTLDLKDHTSGTTGVSLQANVTPSNVTTSSYKVTWSSDTSSVAKINSSDGPNTTVIPVSVGTANIKMTVTPTTGDAITKTVEITVIDTTVRPDPTLTTTMEKDIVVFVNRSASVSVDLGNATDTENIKWTSQLGTSQATGFFSIAADGDTATLFGLKVSDASTMTLTATYGNLSVVFNVQVVDYPVVSIKSDSGSSVELGEFIYLSGSGSNLYGATWDWKVTEGTGIAYLSPEVQNSSSVVLATKAVGTVTVQLTLTTAAGKVTSNSVTIRVTEKQTSTSPDAGEDGSGGSGGEAETIEYYVPTINYSGEDGNMTLATVGSSGTRTVTVGAELTTAEAGGMPFSTRAAAVANFTEKLRWEATGSGNVVSYSGAEDSFARTFYYQNPGQTAYRVYVNFDGNSGFTEGLEEEFALEFTITCTGIAVSNDTVSMATYESADPISVFAYGDITSVTVTSQNTGMVKVETEDISNGTSEVKRITLSSQGETGQTTVVVSSTGGSANISVSVGENVAGTIYPSLTVNATNPLHFSDIIDLLHEEARKVYSGEDLIAAQSIEVSTEQGILYLGYVDAENTGAGVGTSIKYWVDGNPNLSDIVLVPKSTYTGSTITVKYTGITASERTFIGEIVVTIKELGDVYVVTEAQTPVTLSGNEFSQICFNRMGQNLESVVFSLPNVNYAKFYYDYKGENEYHHEIAAGEVLSLSDISRVTVVPSPGFGTPPQNGSTTLLQIPYLSTAVNGATSTAGVMTLEVKPYAAPDMLVYNTRMNEYVTFSSSDFSNNSAANTGSAMSYVTFTLPDPSQGVLYEDYYSETQFRAEVTEDTQYNTTARVPMVSEISFVPAKGFSGAVNITFMGYDVNGFSYTGTVQVNVSTQTTQDINYIASTGGYVSFYEGDFNQLSRDLVGNNIDYIKFTSLPSEYQGSLRLNQTPTYIGVDVGLNIQYFRTGSPYISNLSFQAADGFSGAIDLTFEGMSTGGELFAGTISITVVNQNVVQIPYSATRFNPATMDPEDFNHYSVERTGSFLESVRFVQPDPEVGALYFDYENPDNYDSLVSGDASYFYSGKDPLLSQVTFVPTAGYTGKAIIEFTGFGTNGQSYTGSLVITVTESNDPLYYEIRSGEYVYFSSSAFNMYCKDQTGQSLEYITINLPTSRQGALYHDFNHNNISNSLASDSTRYYAYESRYISDLGFVANSYYIGTVELPFTAVAEDGQTCNGIVTIVVLPLEAQATVTYETSYSPVVFKSSDFAAVWNNTIIDYIELHNLPHPDSGKLYYENNLNSFATVDTFYYGYNPERGRGIDSMIFVPQAGYQGTVTLAYSATTLYGDQFIGEVEIKISAQNSSMYFNDMSGHQWAASSVDYLYNAGVSKGISATEFAPSRLISRGEYALMIQKAFRFADISGQSFTDVPDTAYYSNAIKSLRTMGILDGDDANCFYPEAGISRQDAMIMLCRAMESAQKNLPDPNISVLYNYRDVTSVYTYAANELSIMVQAGVIAGTDDLFLNPQQNMSRAEMAVVLHKAMTY